LGGQYEGSTGVVSSGGVVADKTGLLGMEHIKINGR